MTDKPSDNDAVVIRQFADVRQAEFALSVLQGHGIEGFLDVPFTSSMFPHFALASHGVALLVRSADAEQALEILEKGADGNGEAAELTESE
jgi:hypothetical protein